MTIRTRLLIALLLAAAAGTLIIDLVASRLIHRAVVSRAVQRLTAEARYLELGLHRSWPASVAEADARADEAGRALEARVSILDLAGRVLGDSHVPMHDLGSLENHATRPEIVDAAASGTGHAERLSRSVGELERYVALRVGPRESPRGFVRLAVPVERLGAESGIHGSLVTVISGAGLLLFAALAHVLVSRHSRPIARIAAAADQVSSGRLSEPIGRESDDELGRLAASVDRMRRTLTEQIGRADSERKLLGSILGGLREGILAVNHDRRLLLINASLRRTLELDRESPEGTPLIQLAWDRSILEAFDEALGGASEVRRRVELAGGRSFELTVVPFSDGAGRQAGAIGLFFDVTRLDALERVRRDFIADISHELRTPLASARASSETLQAGALAEPGDADRFLSILSRNLSRMESILNDLTDLSLIETGGISLSRTTVDLSAAVRESAVSIAPRASAR
ncbi:MAG TPA: histidine kinase dimerization/phospho-acceptor domain-containing protein, partial [Candidatus Polarisedimenticolia bacterium]|nr:histidine kinase dimerization/phospho-acceptor domain-containing protein [Candidatus Polarisedimenticolia bacterium]